MEAELIKIIPSLLWFQKQQATVAQIMAEEQRNRVEQALDFAETAAREAGRQRNLAEEERKRADAQRSTAEAAKAEAEQARAAAERAAEELGRQKIFADAQRDAAEKAKAEAVIERDRAQQALAEVNKQKGLAETERGRAEQQARLATARQLVTQARNHLDDRLDLALLLSLEANRVDDTVEGRESLLDGLQHSPRPATFLTGHTNFVSSVAFSPDGKTLASGSEDKTIILWDVSFGSWQARACRIANRNLTRTEWRQYLGDIEPYRTTCPGLPIEEEKPVEGQAEKQGG